MKRILLISLLVLFGWQLSAQDTAEFVGNFILKNGQQISTADLAAGIGDASCKTTIGFKTLTRNCGTCKPSGVKALYRLYLSGSVPGVFQEIGLVNVKAETSGGVTCWDTTRQNAAANAVGLGNLPNGSYSLDFYFESTGEGCSANPVKTAVFSTVFTMKQPTINVQPIDLVNCSGGAMLFKTVVTGIEPTFQWYRSDSKIAAEALTPGSRYTTPTAANLEIKNLLVANHENLFWCVITDKEGCETVTRKAKATVNHISTPITSATSYCETSAIEVRANITEGNPISYQWQYQPGGSGNYVNLTDGGDVTGATATVLKISNITSNYTKLRVQGRFATITATDAGLPESGNCSVTSATKTLTINPKPAKPPVSSFTRCGPGIISLVAPVASAAYRWFSDTTATDESRSQTFTPNVAANKQYFFGIIDAKGCESYRSTADVTVHALPTVALGSIESVCQGVTSVNLPYSGLSNADQYSLASDNSVFAAVDKKPLAASPISIVIPATTAAGTYNFSLNVTNSATTCQSASIPFALRLKPTTVITQNIQNSTACEGNSFNFTLKAEGENISYQWFKDTKAIAGATTPALSFNAVTPGDAGLYSGQVSGECGTIASVAAELTVKPAVIISQQPQDKTSCESGSVTFELKATGSGTLSYQWKKNGVDVGTNAEVLVLNNVSSADNGAVITCEITSDCGITASAKAVLTVVPLPALPSVSSPIGFCQDAASATISAGTTGNNTLLWWGNDATGGSSSMVAPTPSTAAAGSSVFYVSQRTPEGCEGGRAAIQVIISKKFSVTVEPSQTAVCVAGEINRTANLSAVIIGGTQPFAFQWLKENNPIANASGESYAATSGGNYTVSVTSGYCSIQRAVAITTLFPELLAAPAASDVSVCLQNTATLIAASDYSGGGFRWYDSPTGTAVVSNQNPYVISNIAASQTLYAVYRKTDAATACETPRKQVVVTVGQPLVVTSQPVNATKCRGNTASFSATITNATAYQWERQLPNGNFEPIVGENASTLRISSVGNATNPHLTNYRVSASGGGCSVVSNAVTLFVNSKDANLESISVCGGSNASFTVPATTGTVESFQWQKRVGSSGPWEDVPGKTATVIVLENVTAADDNTYYRCRLIFTNGDGSTCTITTDDARLTVKPATTIISAPSNAVVCEGTAFAFETKAVGDGPLTYQWFTRGRIIAGATSATLNFPAVSAANAGKYSCRVTGGCGIVVTDSVSLTVKPAVIISQQPQNAKSCEQASAKFEINATGSGTLNYQWKKNGIIVGENSNVLILSNLARADNGATITCDVLSDCKTVTSSTAMLTVVPLPALPSVVSPIGYCENATSTALTAGKTDGNALLWWGNDATGGSSAMAAPTPSTATAGSSVFYVSQRTPEGCEGSRAAIQVIISEKFSVTVNPSQTAVCVAGEINRTANLSAVITGGTQPFAFQWLKENNPIANASGESYAATSGGNYTVSVTSGYCSIQRAVTITTLFPELLAAPAASDVSVCLQNTATLIAASGYTGGGFRWYDSPTGTTVVSNQNPYVISNIAASQTLYAVYRKTDAATACETPRKQVVVTVGQPLVVTSQPVNATKCRGNTASFSAAITNATAYQWERQLPNGNFGPIVGENASTLRISSVGNATNLHLTNYRVSASGGGCSVVSNAVTLFVNSKDANLESITVCAGSNASFTVPATTGTVESFQWQKRVGPSGPWEDVAGKTATVIVLENVTAADDNTYYRCRLIFTNGDGSTCTITTDDARLTVKTVSLTVVKTDVKCFGQNSGAIVVTASGGTTPYNYQLNAAAFQTSGNYPNLLAGNYKINVNDAAGCTATTDVSVVEPSALEITEIATKPATCEGAIGSISVKANGGTGKLTYSLNGVLFVENPVFEKLTGGQYTVTVKDVNGCTVTQNATIEGKILPQITTQPVDLTNCSGNTLTFTVGTTNVVTYQWQRQLPGEEFKDMIGENATSLRISNVGNATNPHASNYRVIVKNPDCEVVSNIAKLNANSISGSEPDKVVCLGSDFTFDLNKYTIVGTIAAIQWQYRESTSGSWADIAGKTDKTFTLNSLQNANSGYYRARLTFSSTAGTCLQYNETGSGQKLTVIVNAAPTISTPQTTLCGTASATLTATGCVGTVIWSDGSAGTRLVVSEAGIYSAKCNLENCDGLSSNEITIVRGSSPTVPVISAEKTALCNDEKTTLKATNCEGTVTWSNALTGISIDVSQSGSYSATCKNVCGTSAASNKIVITTDKTPLPGKIEGVSTTNCVGYNPPGIVNVESASGGTLQWQVKTAVADWTTIAGATSSTYNPGVLNDTTSYRRLAVSSCGTSISNVITYRIAPDPAVTVNVSKTLICANEVVTLNASVSGGSGNCPITWQQNDRSSAPTSTFWVNVTGSAETLQISDLTNNTADKKTYYFRAIVDCQPTSCNKATATAVGVEVQASAVVNLNFTDSTICQATTVKLTAMGCGGTLKWSNGETTTSISVSPSVTTIYQVSCTTSCSVATKSATVSVQAGSVPLPQNTTPSGVVNPQALQFSATGNNLKWYSKATGGVGQAEAPTYTNPGSYTYYVTQTQGRCESARLKITSAIYLPLKITAQTANEYDCQGNSVDFVVNASGVGTLKFQWQRKRPGENEFINLTKDGDGVKNSSLSKLTISAVGNDNNPHLTQFRCIVRDSLTALTTNEMTLFVNSLTGSFENIGKCVGANYEVNLKELFVVTGDVATYQWQRRPGTSGSWNAVENDERISGVTTETLKIISLKAEDGMYYRCSVTFKTGGVSCAETTDPSRLVVGDFPAAPAGFELSYCQYEQPKTLTFRTAADNDALWYISENQAIGNKKAPVPATATPGQVTYFISEITDQGCESPKVAVKINVNPQPAPPVNTTPAFVKEGTTLKFTAEGSNLRWFTSQTGLTSTTESPVYTAPKSYKHYVSQTSEFGCQSDRTAIEAIIRDALAFKKLPVSQADCDGNSVIFETDAKGWGDVTYQWQVKQPTASDFTNLTGETAKKLTIKNVGEGINVTGTEYRCLIKDADDALFSTPAALTVNKIEGTIPDVSLCDGQRIWLDSTKLKVSGLVNAYEWQRQQGTLWQTINTPDKWLDLGNADSTKTADYRLKVVFKVNDKLTCNRYTKETKIVVHAVPLAPTVAAFSVCKNSPKNLTVNPLKKTNKILWFTSPTDSVALQNPPNNLTAKVGRQTIYITERSDKGCDSKRMAVNFTVLPTPDKPLTDSLLTVCQYTSVATLTALSAGNVLWSKATATDFQDAKPSIRTDVNGNQIFFVMAVDSNGCQSENQRIVVNVQPCIASVTDLPQNDCVVLSKNNVSGKDWVNFFDESGRLYVSLHPDNQDLGTVTLNYRRFATDLKTSGGTVFLSRYFSITSSKKQVFEQQIKIRVYAGNTELSVPGNSDVWSVVRYSGINEDCTPRNNDNFKDGGSEVMYENVSTKPYAPGLSYVEFPTRQFAEFGFTINPFANATLTAAAREDAVLLQWDILNEVRPLRYFIERSTDGISWFAWREVDVRTGNELLDLQPLANKTFYRLVFQDIDGTLKYFPSVSAGVSGEEPICLIYPNPVVSDEPLNLYVRNLIPVSVEFYDVNLRRWGFEIDMTEPNNYRLTLSTTLAHGTYFVRLVDETDRSCVAKIVKR